MPKTDRFGYNFTIMYLNRRMDFVVVLSKYSNVLKAQKSAIWGKSHCFPKILKSTPLEIFSYRMVSMVLPAK